MLANNTHPPKRLRLTAPVTSENELHEAVATALDRLLMPPAVWTHFPAGSVPLPPQFGEKLMRMGMKRGWPDILVLHKHLYGIELKRVGGLLSKSRMVRRKNGSLRLVEGQRETFLRLEAAGMVGPAVCCSVDAVLDTLLAWSVPMRCRADRIKEMAV